ncbi:DUF4214 domain-containing protein [Paracraurococcus ruber]|nr:DUF4214 domain-containing protein [Paracraurococcus ruber]
MGEDRAPAATATDPGTGRETDPETTPALLPATGRAWEAGDLLGGDDHDFVCNIYLAVLGRLPDAAGYRHYRAAIAGRPEHRTQALRDMAASEEAARAGAAIRFPDTPAPPPGPARARAVTQEIRLDWLQREVLRLQEAMTLAGGAGLAADAIEARDAALHFEIASLRREVEERLDALLGPVPAEAAAARDAAIAALTRVVGRHVADRVAALEAQFETRFRGLEERLLHLEARREA